MRRKKEAGGSEEGWSRIQDNGLPSDYAPWSARFTLSGDSNRWLLSFDILFTPATLIDILRMPQELFLADFLLSVRTECTIKKRNT